MTVVRITAKFGAGNGRSIERRHDTILYRKISILSIAESKTYRYSDVETTNGASSHMMIVPCGVWHRFDYAVTPLTTTNM
jgi:hypothetical protein